MIPFCVCQPEELVGFSSVRVASDQRTPSRFSHAAWFMTSLSSPNHPPLKNTFQCEHRPKRRTLTEKVNTGTLS